jgi:hypothetical protein
MGFVVFDVFRHAKSRKEYDEFTSNIYVLDIVSV